MLSKSEFEILKGLADLITKRDMEKIRNEILKSTEKRKSTTKIRRLETRIKFYLNKYSDNYRRVLKHRIKKKTQQMINDLIIILQTYEHLGMSIKDFLPNDKHIMLRHYFPQSITLINGKGGSIDVKFQRDVSLKDLLAYDEAYDDHKNMQEIKSILEKLGHKMK